VAVEMFGVFADLLRLGTAEAGEKGRHLPKRLRRRAFQRYRRGVRQKYRKVLELFAEDVRAVINFVAMDEAIFEDAPARNTGA
jgi:hypothetical protein